MRYLPEKGILLVLNQIFLSFNLVLLILVRLLSNGQADTVDE